MPDLFVLRFRDIAGDSTIESHRRLIRAAGYVWWGWWKKDSEPHHIRDLEEMSERAKAAPMVLGLFDRSTKSFYVGEAVECIFSEDPIASPEPQKTPSYYSSEKAPAWFKLSNINELEEKLFIERFGPLPTGEATLFPVRHGARPASEAADAVQLSSSSVLHLSDIHFGIDYGFPLRNGPGRTPLLDIIERDFRDEQIGMVVVSGDITSRADANVLQDDGLNFLAALSDRLRVPRECFVLVPGNHDIALKKFRPVDYSHEASFHLFTKEFYGHATTYPQLRRYVLPGGRPIEFLAINSVRLRHESEKQFGYVQWPLYDSLLSASPRNEDAFRIAVLHHHLVPAPREEILDPNYLDAAISSTLDAGAVIEGLQAHGFGLALHGHQHVPAVTRIVRGCSPYGNVNFKNLNGIVVLAAGSAGASRLHDEMRDNSYNIVRFGERGGFNAEARRYNQGLAPERLFQIRST